MNSPYTRRNAPTPLSQQIYQLLVPKLSNPEDEIGKIVAIALYMAIGFAPLFFAHVYQVVQSPILMAPLAAFGIAALMASGMFWWKNRPPPQVPNLHAYTPRPFRKQPLPQAEAPPPPALAPAE